MTAVIARIWVLGAISCGREVEDVMIFSPPCWAGGAHCWHLDLLQEVPLGAEVHEMVGPIHSNPEVPVVTIDKLVS